MLEDKIKLLLSENTYRGIMFYYKYYTIHYDRTNALVIFNGAISDSIYSNKEQDIKIIDSCIVIKIDFSIYRFKLNGLIQVVRT